MAKKPMTEVDEQMLQAMMTGDVPMLKKTEKSPDIAVETVPLPQDKESSRKVKTDEKNSSEYREKFLQPDTKVKYRSQVYISASLHGKIKRFLSVSAPQVTMGMFISNVLDDHFCNYANVVKELYNEQKDDNLW